MTNKLLIDFNQCIIGAVHIGAKNFGSDLNMDMIRHLTLNSILYYRKRFDDYTDTVICCDGPRSWRKDHYPYYKAVRRKSRDESPLDWDLIHDAINHMEEELDTYFPYRVVRVDRAEGDDVIAVLIKHFQKDYDGVIPPKIKIISSDKDFIQLHSIPGVSQYSPITKKEVFDPEPEKYLFEQILKGDRGDGVPNFRSSDECLTRGIRQRPVTQKRLDECWDAKDPMQFCSTEELSNYSRNKKMIDLIHDEIPQDVVDAIIAKYESAKEARRSEIWNYMTKYKLMNLLDEIQNF